MILPMEIKHVKQVAELHFQYVSSLLGDLGRRMCIIFYENALKSDNNFGYVYIEDSEVLGFIFGTRDNSQPFRCNRIRLETFLSLLRKPYLIKDLFSHLRNKFPPSAERLYAAVDTTCRHKGIAMKLYVALNQGFRERGITYFEDSVDIDNVRSLTLQRFLGAKIKHDFVERGIRRYRLYTRISAW